MSGAASADMVQDRSMPAHDSARGEILSSVLERFESAGLQYCILHGYEDYPLGVASDVDCLVDPDVPLRKIYALLKEACARSGATLVRTRGYHVVLALRMAEGSFSFLTLDLCRESECRGLPFYTGAEVLANRRRFRGFWVPPADVACAAYLARCIARRVLDETRIRRLTAFYRGDCAGCARQLARFWGGDSSRLILAALQSGNWTQVRQRLDDLRGELLRRCALRFPARLLRNALHRWVERAQRLVQPDGVSVVFLGPDGAGKSSTIDVVGGAKLAAAFDRSVCWGFVPPLHRLTGRNDGPSSQPHALPPRSVTSSIAKALYWLVFLTVGYPLLHLALARGTLVLYDRHLVDVLVDPKRYRYGGPLWLMRLIWSVIPKPDLVILLNAPPEVVHARKREVPLLETAGQARAYSALVRSLRYGHEIDSSQPLERVADQSNGVILSYVAERTGRRL